MSLRTLPLLALAVTALSACGSESTDSSEAAATRDLLRVAPARVLEVPGLLAPDPTIVWADRGGAGWESELVVHDGREVARSDGHKARLDLPGPSEVERTLSLELARTGKTDGVRLTFNGVELGVLQLSDALTEHSFPIPAALWSRSANELRLETMSGKGVVLMGPMTITPGEAFDRQAGTLDPNVTVTWELLLREGGLLDLDVTARAAGTLTVDLRLGAPGAAPGPAVQTDAFPLTAGERLPMRLPLPAPGRDLLHVTLDWQAEDMRAATDAALELHAVSIFEDAPFERPPILFVSVDTLAAQNMSLHGYDRETTPRLAEFAADCVTFNAARANAPWTVPSYTSQLTGLYPTANHLPQEVIAESDTDTAMDWYQVPASRLTLAELMLASGYRTAAFVDNPWLTNIAGLDQGFEIYDEEAAEVSLQDADMGMRYVLPKASEFLRADDPRPPFVMAQIFDVHGPYLTHEPWAGAFEAGLDEVMPTVLPIANTGKTVFGAVPLYVAKKRAGETATSVRAEYVRADYDATILELDATLGAFFDELRAEGLYDDLLIIVSADHGEGMEDHDWLFRHGLVYDSSSHVPLMVKLPGSANAGARVDTPVQLVDLMPTLADLLGYDLGDYGHGRSLVPALEGAELPSEPVLMVANLMQQKAVLVDEWKLTMTWPSNGPLESLLTYQPLQALLHAERPELFEKTFNGPPPIPSRTVVEVVEALGRDNPELKRLIAKAILALDPFVELHDLANDPFETRDVSAAHPERVAELRELLLQEFARAEPYRNFEDAGPIALGEEMKAELEALGYVAD